MSIAARMGAARPQISQTTQISAMITSVKKSGISGVIERQPATEPTVDAQQDREPSRIRIGMRDMITITIENSG